MTDKRQWTRGIGGRIRLIRKKASLDQLEFGVSVGVTRQSISAYETGRLKPSRNAVERMSDLYGVKPWWVLYGSIKDKRTDDVSRWASKSKSSKLTNAQQTLMRYVLENRKAADELTRNLFNRATKVS